MLHSIAQPWMWAVFIAFVLGMLAIDVLALGGSRAHKVSIREAAAWSLVWVSLALLFDLGLWLYLSETVGREFASIKAMEFLTGYVIEKSLSIDNVFVFLLIFGHFSVPVQYQRKVLLYGVVGAIVMRIIMILAGSWVVTQFAWVLYLFGIFLVITGFRMLVSAEHKPDLEANPVLRLAKKLLPFTKEFHEEKFSVKINGKRFFTPLLLVLLLIEVSDVVFAVDSIPAIFAVTTDPFIVFTSNIFAIMGLRALYFLLADMADRFHLLKFGLAFVLMFVGIKMLIVEQMHIPTNISLLVIGIILGGSILASLFATRGGKH
ncbi:MULTISPECIES: TerC family protein [unclassified Undibacterium]|uniref:TerC family protein n=1 Tax=unclassified Undibacterium TaxID=2630295 RepID=UPI002AC8E5B4|nr:MULTISPECIES: TerC family protein [unclassified Undibacterium]MEB0137777.1 TerC family protein [Undibacterium sp. CCC2.1]MEB0171032.1 TerC family protein [Undibacterium sp. CCC1.1]MEB0175077.1 TerC family protein [Undibacterium sp. CCC3.4]MEB0215145.1 TerC family protein [Undibacterium sp. 5I2]WPX44881.1 TerC family protein [Undibacterium sp. CCC3.4]